MARLKKHYNEVVSPKLTKNLIIKIFMMVPS